MHRNPTAIWISHLVVCMVTGLFFMPLTILIFVHSKNFCTNRTTNERFGGKKYKATSQSEANENESAYSTSTSLLAEEIIQEIGKPEDFS